MKPQLGDTILNRYTLVSTLRHAPGLTVWKASDRVMAKDCQLAIVTSGQALAPVNSLTGRIAASRPAHFVPVLKYRPQAEVMLVITPLDEGLSLTDYFAGAAGSLLSYDAMRSIVGETIEAIRPIIDGNNPAEIILSTDTVRITASGVQIADAPFSCLLADTSGTAPYTPIERHAVRQLAALLYAMLTRTPSTTDTAFSMDRLPADTPMEFQVIVKRGLALMDDDDSTLPMAALIELEALLGDWKPLTDLADTDIALPHVSGECSIATAMLASVDEQDVADIPDTLISSEKLPNLAINQSLPALAFVGDTDEDAADAHNHAGNAASGQAGDKERRLFDFNLSDNLSEAWRDENLSGEDTGDWFTSMHPHTMPAGDNIHPTVPISTAEAGVGETTSRIPVFDADGRPIAPGEESERALEYEQEQIAAMNPVPPSFTPQDHAHTEENDKLPDERLFGSLSTKVVAIVVAVLVVIAAAIWAMNAFQGSSLSPADRSNNVSEGQWPELDVDDVPFGSSTGGQTSDSEEENDENTQSSNTTSSNSDSDSSSTSSSDSKNTKDKVKTGDKDSKAVPDPKHVNTTAYTVASSNFLTNPGGQSGYAYYLHLDQPHDVYRMTITIRTSGGKGYIRANTTGDPTQGDQVAEFEFAEGGTTEIPFTRVINTQDLILWVPTDSLPQNQLYIEKVEVF
ncbi:virulence factor MviN [Bifidobacterium oedipodis]|uniref:Virulence factor MviN n=1 Tax=Bifidobacterium oedipodis TaxID=2675322 RepID=A0A7Y0ERT9_9BIFI|nr:virulence factor MviN [Bifidobacterium sp. DSM 109957]NMM94813.1 virulence factor MviN [Bifidobacterium sp. DSM 109957]